MEFNNMSLASINRTIRALCFEVDAVSDARTNWRNLSEIDLLYEAVVCMFSSQMMFEVSVAAADRLKVLGLLCGGKMGVAHLNYEARLLEALSYPLEVEINGTHRTMMPSVHSKHLVCGKIIQPCKGVAGFGGIRIWAKAIKSILAASWVLLGIGYSRYPYNGLLKAGARY
jgi:hypothetical protein